MIWLLEHFDPDPLISAAVYILLERCRDVLWPYSTTLQNNVDTSTSPTSHCQLQFSYDLRTLDVRKRALRCGDSRKSMDHLEWNVAAPL